MFSIAIIIPYFGKWPSWIDLFFQSCQNNIDIDFFFYTDCTVPQSALNSPNIHFIQISFDDYCQLASKKLGIDFSPKTPLKLCDLRPFYGLIHEEQLKEYDFWGYGDVDVVWGDIRKFYTNDVLKKYDVLSTHTDRLSGHLAILRNNERYRMQAFKCRKWRELLTNEKNQIFDEQNFTLTFHPIAKLLWKTHKWIFRRFRFKNDWSAYNNFCLLINKLLMLPQRRVLFVERETTPWPSHKTWNYTNGHVTDNSTGEELIYLHFLDMKKKWEGDYYHFSPNGVTISFEGIQPQNS